MKTTHRIAPIAAAALALATTLSAQAVEPITFGDGYTLDWNLGLTYGVAQRVGTPSPLLTSAKTNAGANDGDNNFKKGSLTSNGVSALFQGKLSKGDSGFVLSASDFYDSVYHRTNDNSNAPNNPNGVNSPPPFNQFTSATRTYMGGYGRILDAYGYTTLDVGGGRSLNVKIGRQVVNWGEALFYPNIAQAQGPFDGTKTGIPGAAVKDTILPEDQLSLSLAATPRWTLLGQVQFGFHETIAPAVGSYLSTSDGVGPGAYCLGPFTSIPAVAPAGFGGFNGCSFGSYRGDIRPSKVGQWGIGTRYRLTDQTEAGLYYLDFNDRTPLPVINSFTPGTAIPAALQAAFGGLSQIGNGSYQVRFFNHVKMLGTTLSTLASDSVSVASEASYRWGAPVLVNTVVNPATGATIPNPTRADVATASVNFLANLGNTPVAPQTTLLGEVSGSYVNNIQPLQAPGVQTLPAAFQAAFPASSQLSYVRPFALAYTVQASFGYPGIAEGWDMTIPISFSNQVTGRSLVGTSGSGQGDRRIGIGATFVRRSNLTLSVNYLAFLGSPNTGLLNSNLLADRNFVSLSAKYTF